MTTTYYKAVRPDGTSFHDPSFRWVPKSGPIPDDGLLVSHPLDLDRRSAAGYLSVSTVPTDCTGMEWPCQLLALTPVRGRKVVTPEPYSLPNKRGASAWLVVDRLDPHLALGPQGPEVAAIIERAGWLTQEEAARLGAARDAAWDAAWGAARIAARDAAWDAAWGAAWNAARGAAWNAAGDTAWYAAWDAARGAARDAAGDAAWNAAWYAARYAARDAAIATVARDLISPADYQTLAGPWLSVIGETR